MLSRVPHVAWVALLGAVLYLPMLGSFGLWDPAEIQHADVAREVAEKGSFRDVTVDGRYGPRPVLYVWLVAAGFKVLGVNELAGRLPLALCGILALLLAYRLGRRLLAPGAGLGAAFVLGTTPLFLFQARQLTSEIPYYAALLATIGGFAAYLWPADGKRRRMDLALFCLGLVAAVLARGLLLGGLFPLVCVGLALALGWRTENRPGEEGLWPWADGPDLKPEESVGEAFRKARLPLLAALAVAAGLVALALRTLKGGPFLLLGGELHRLTLPPTFEIALRDLGFGLFPWVGVAPIALFLFVAAQGTRSEERGRDAFVKLLLVVLVIVGYIAAVFWEGYLGKTRFPALPFVAIAVGIFGYERFTRPLSRPLWGLVAALIILALHLDFFGNPDTLSFSHLLGASAKFPSELNLKAELRAFGLAAALAAFFALGGTPRPIGLDFSRRWTGRLARPFARALNFFGDWLRGSGGEAGERYWLFGGGVGLVFAGWCAFYLTPHLSLHMSNKALFETYHACKGSSDRLAQYQVSGRGAAYYNHGQVDEVTSQDNLFAMLRKPERSFVLIPTSQLGAIDQAARQTKLPYYVLDDRNSQYTIVSNLLGGRCDKDLNPLRRLILSQRPTPKRAVTANFEGKVKLIGYDVPDSVTRGGKFKITLYFEVLDRLPAGYKLFVHFDQPASRFHGDHEPLGGKYPTQYWLPGDFVVDPHEVEIPILTTPGGDYQIYVGFWQGDNRLKVTEGPNDGVNRVPVGVLVVR